MEHWLIFQKLGLTHTAIDEILGIVGKLCSASTEDEKSELVEKFSMVLDTVKPILVGAKDITGKKADQVIDEVVKIGDMLTKVQKGKMEKRVKRLSNNRCYSLIVGFQLFIIQEYENIPE